MTIYLLNRKVSNEITEKGPNPTEEHQKALEDITVTSIYTGDLVCVDCDGILITLSISRESEEVNEGTYVMSKTFLGSDRDTENIEGSWTLKNENREKVLILKPEDNSETEQFVQEDESTLRLIRLGDSLPENEITLILLE